MPREPIFVSRKFPPSVGGMETLAAGVHRALTAQRPGTVTLAMGRANVHLLWWVPLTALRLVRLVLLRRVDFVLAGDALMNAVVGAVLRPFDVPVATMVMGLDVTYENRLYQRVVAPALLRSSRVVAISAATAQRVVDLGVPRQRVTVLRLGVRAPVVTPAERAEAGRAVRDRLGLAHTDQLVLTLGRLVRRKGARWFCEAVVPALEPDVHYLVAGTGPEEEAIAAAAQEVGCASRVHLLGRVSDEGREELLRACDVFVQPNVRVRGDMEGFGLVTIEAGMRGLLVVAADLEGIRDAVQDGRTGVLLPAEEPEAWVDRLRALLADRRGREVLAARYGLETRRRFGEEAMGEALLAAMRPGEARS